MGLDLMLYNKRLYDKYEAEEIDYKEFSKMGEVAYGRKTWAIADWFTARSTCIDPDRELYLVSESTWDEFYNTFAPYSFLLQKFVDEVSEFDNMSDEEEERMCEEEPEYYEQDRINYLAANRAVEVIIESIFPFSTCQLGPVWEARALIRWISAYLAGKDAYKDEGLVLVRSY